MPPLPEPPLRELQRRFLDALLGAAALAGSTLRNARVSLDRQAAVTPVQTAATAPLDRAGSEAASALAQPPDPPRSEAASTPSPPLDASWREPAPLLAPSLEAALPRLEIYRNNARANFVDALHSSYPVLWRLVGEEYFRHIARQFQLRSPSRSGDLLHAGSGLADHVRELHAADEFNYLADVAQLEWLIQEALLAADHAPLDLAKLAALDPGDYDEVRFELHPTLRLFSSPYPALRIWEANVNAAEPESIDLGSGGVRMAVMRSRLQLTVHHLRPGEYGLLCALQRRESFAAAVDAGAASEAEFDAGATLRRFVAAEAIVDFR